jgi:uncharacterized membrane protein (UPF0127 family)
MTMQTVQVLNATKGTVLGDSVAVADTSLRRMVGLLGRAALEAGTGMLIMPSQAVHTIAMRFPIDIVFVDRNWRVVHLQPVLVPNRITGLHWRARCVLELPSGAIAQTGTAVGDQLVIAD